MTGKGTKIPASDLFRLSNLTQNTLDTRLLMDLVNKISNEQQKTPIETTPNPKSPTTVPAPYNPYTSMRQRSKDILTRCNSRYNNYASYI